MQEKNKLNIEEQAQGDECHHIWLIEVRPGPMSAGVCKLCGAKMKFRNCRLDCNGDEDVVLLFQIDTEITS